jgi:hypothetical protein
MKRVFVQKEVIGWEEYVFEVPDDFEDYKSLIDSDDWIDWEYLTDASENTGKVEILDNGGDVIYSNLK